MTKIKRRQTSVSLYQGNYEQELATLLDRTMAAERDQSVQVRKFGQVSESIELAKQYDTLLAEAESSAVVVPLWAISYTEWDPIADMHPPREDDKDDAQRGVNMKTFPGALLRASLVAPGESEGVNDLLAKGDAALNDLGDLSRVQYVKLERAAWQVNVGDDALPKISLVSLLQAQRGDDSKPQSDSE